MYEKDVQEAGQEQEAIFLWSNQLPRIIIIWSANKYTIYNRTSWILVPRGLSKHFHGLPPLLVTLTKHIKYMSRQLEKGAKQPSSGITNPEELFGIWNRTSLLPAPRDRNKYHQGLSPFRTKKMAEKYV